MSRLNGSQSEKLRLGLQRLFPEFALFEMFLREKLDKNLNIYAPKVEAISTAYFRVLIGAESEGWINTLIECVLEAKLRDIDIEIIAGELGIIANTNITDGSETKPPLETNSPQPFWKEFKPYRGLLALRERDTDFLFGRDHDVDRFIDAISTDQSTIQLAFGASGVGKSSLIFAGVLGALKRRERKGETAWPDVLKDSHQWPYLVLTPGTEPVRNLAAAFVGQWMDPTTPAYATTTDAWRQLLIGDQGIEILVHAADQAQLRMQQDPPSHYLIYVDQGEELYTRAGRDPRQDRTKKETQQQKEARRFSELLAEAALHPRLIVLMSARSDFLGQLQADKRVFDEHPAKIFDVHQQLNITPLDESGIKQVITRPAEMLGVKFENGLDNALAAATREEIGGLPLLSDTLETLWQEMQNQDEDEPVLRWPEGEPIDITKKLADRADGFVKAHPDQQADLRQLFCLRLSHVPMQGAPTRQRAFLSELSDTELKIVEALASDKYRILVTGQSEGRAVVEVAHEKLFSAWSTLRTWLDGPYRAFYAWTTQVQGDRIEWEKNGYQKKDLLIGRPLERARDHLETERASILANNIEFIEKSLGVDRIRRRWNVFSRWIIASSLVAAVMIAIRTYRLLENATVVRDNALARQSRLLSNLSNQATADEDGASGTLLALEAFADQENSGLYAKRVDEPIAELALTNARRRLREKRVLAGHKGWIMSVAATSDGKRVITGSDDNTARLWDIADGRELARFVGHEAAITSVAVMPDNTRIITGSLDGTARIWDVATGREIARLQGHTGPIWSVAVTSDGMRVITASSDRTARIWDASTGRVISEFIGHEGALTSVAVTKDGARIVTGSVDLTARVWDATDARELVRLTGHTNAISSVAVSLDGIRVITGSLDGTARIWDAANGRELTRLNGNAGIVESVAAMPDGRVISGSWDGKARIWDPASGRELFRLVAHDGPIRSVAVTPDGTHLITGSWDGTARIWDAAIELGDIRIASQEGRINSVAVASDGSLVAAASEDGIARIWRADDGGQVAKLMGHQGAVTSIAMISDHALVITGSVDWTARIWDSVTGRELIRLTGHEGSVNSVAVLADESRVVTGSDDSTARIWDAASGRELIQLIGHAASINCVTISPDGTRVITGSDDRTARIWDAASGRELVRLVGHEGPITSVTMTHDGTRILTGSSDKTVRIWDTASGRELARLVGHEAGIDSVAVTKDDRRVVTASFDNTLRVWDVASGAEVDVLAVFENPVHSVVIMPDGTHFLTDFDERSRHGIKIWRLFPSGSALVADARRAVPRCLTRRQRQFYSLPATIPRWCFEMAKWPYD